MLVVSSRALSEAAGIFRMDSRGPIGLVVLVVIL